MILHSRRYIVAKADTRDEAIALCLLLQVAEPEHAGLAYTVQKTTRVSPRWRVLRHEGQAARYARNMLWRHRINPRR